MNPHSSDSTHRVYPVRSGPSLPPRGTASVPTPRPARTGSVLFTQTGIRRRRLTACPVPELSRALRPLRPVRAAAHRSCVSRAAASAPCLQPRAPGDLTAARERCALGRSRMGRAVMHHKSQRSVSILSLFTFVGILKIANALVVDGHWSLRVREILPNSDIIRLKHDNVYC